MLEHWSDAYVDMPYAKADCAELCALVRREIFGHTVWLPTERGFGLRDMNDQIEGLFHEYVVRTSDPADGDVALMFCRGRLRHVGILCLIGRHTYVLHAMKIFGRTCRHRTKDLFMHGLTIEGYYRWR